MKIDLKYRIIKTPKVLVAIARSRIDYRQYNQLLDRNGRCPDLCRSKPVPRIIKKWNLRRRIGQLGFKSKSFLRKL